MASFINEENDCILVHTDAGFNVCLMALSGLSQANILEYQSMQEVSINNIESNNPHDVHRFVFGGQHAGKRERRIQTFAKTASSVLRMCMLRSANAGPCPLIGPNSHARNRAKMEDKVHSKLNIPKFELSPTYNKMHVMEYYSYYDKMHPLFMIENQLLQCPPGKKWLMKATMMLIFRKNFSEVIEFGTNLDATDMSGVRVRDQYGVYTHPPGSFASNVNVRRILRKITNPNHPSLQLLKALCNSEIGAQHILETYEKGLRMNLPENVPLPLRPAESDEESDDYEESEDEEDGEFLDYAPPVPVKQMQPPNYYIDDGHPEYTRLNQQMTAMGINF